MERRRFPRVPSWLSATYARAGAESPQPTVARNVSGGGCAFFTSSLLPAGTVLELTLEAEGRRVACTARVMWSGKLLLTRPDEYPWAYEAGVRFLQMAQEDLAFLLRAATSTAPPI